MSDELKKADEIVRALKECGDCDTCPYYDCWIDEHTGGLTDACDEGRLFRDVIALIESLQAQLSASQRREKAAVEEVCRRCPDGEIIDGLKHYPCDGCKWRGPVAEEGGTL